MAHQRLRQKCIIPLQSPALLRQAGFLQLRYMLALGTDASGPHLVRLEGSGVHVEVPASLSFTGDSNSCPLFLFLFLFHTED